MDEPKRICQGSYIFFSSRGSDGNCVHDFCSVVATKRKAFRGDLKSSQFDFKRIVFRKRKALGIIGLRSDENLKKKHRWKGPLSPAAGLGQDS